MKFKNKTKLFRKRDWSKPLNDKEKMYTFQSYHLLPYELAIELINLDYLHKSPSSLSFYDRRKDYGYTEEGTVRFSDHWNYKSKRDGKIHSITNITMKEKQWAKGVYDSSTDTFKIVKIYDPKRMTKAQYRKEIAPIFRKQLDEARLAAKPSDEIIEKRKEFTRMIKAGRVMYNFDGELIRVIKHGNSRIDLEKSNGEKISLKRGTQNTFTKVYPDFAYIIDGVKHTEEMLREQNIMHGKYK